MMISSTSWRRFGLGRQIALVVGLSVAVAGCQTIADLDPTGLLGGSSDTSQPSQFPADQAPPTASDQAQGTTPDLASVPARPTASSPAQQQQAAQSLASDGAQARYSADALRGGTEAAAAPPPADAGAPTAAQRILAAPSAANAADLPPTAEPTPQMAANLPPTAEPAPTARAALPALPDGAQPAPAANVPISNASGGNAAVPPSANARTASVTPTASASPVGSSAPASAMAPRREPAVPAVPANTPMRGTMMAQPQLTDAALGFKTSNAPPLASSVNDFVSEPIIAHYQQTASNTGMTGAIAAVPSRGVTGGSAAVVTNMAAVASAPAAIAAMNGGVPPTAVIYFPGDGTSLSTAARTQVRAAVTAFKANGGQGTVRVIGHASSRTADMAVEKHLETIFDKSQARANAVAQELIHDGVPATRVLIDAVGDSQPIYYESMPQGEEGNRRAEIFVQG